MPPKSLKPFLTKPEFILSREQRFIKLKIIQPQDFILLRFMVMWLHKLLFVAVSFSFFISATEMDLGESHNTFFDEYDTYVKTEQVSSDHLEITQAQQQELLEFTSSFFAGCLYVSEAQRYECPDYKKPNASPPKLYLRNSVWRI